MPSESHAGTRAAANLQALGRSIEGKSRGGAKGEREVRSGWAVVTYYRHLWYDTLQAQNRDSLQNFAPTLPGGQTEKPLPFVTPGECRAGKRWEPLRSTPPSNSPIGDGHTGAQRKVTQPAEPRVRIPGTADPPSPVGSRSSACFVAGADPSTPPAFWQRSIAVISFDRVSWTCSNPLQTQSSITTIVVQAFRSTTERSRDNPTANNSGLRLGGTAPLAVHPVSGPAHGSPQHARIEPARFAPQLQDERPIGGNSGADAGGPPAGDIDGQFAADLQAQLVESAAERFRR